jgi:hypothetical protein
VIVLAVSSNDVAPGTLGFLVVAGMGLALFFLFRSMSKHLRKVNDQARQEEEASAARADHTAMTGDGGDAGQDRQAARDQPR